MLNRHRIAKRYTVVIILFIHKRIKIFYDLDLIVQVFNILLYSTILDEIISVYFVIFIQTCTGRIHTTPMSRRRRKDYSQAEVNYIIDGNVATSVVSYY